ncbi:MAG: hypothetical protein PHQ84_05090 [Candidatus Omnitrophica bacterium]|jgi:hypothetical protein|nr:hypothetical protein [Candidatus Omnitrophota bacterium]MDD5078358.1 hypothetical protein [Candidatus Omnitrophota bacterium]
MAKKELPEKPEQPLPRGKENFSAESRAGGLSGDFSSKISGLSSKFFGVVKFLLAVVILPLVYSSLVAFSNEFLKIDASLQQVFYNGIISFLAIYLFIWEPAVIYRKGHKLLEILFSFVKPMVNVAPFLLPIYTILIFILYGLFSLGIKSAWLVNYTVFLIGFSVILHLTFSARTIRSKKGDFMKANYIFGFSFIFILNIALLALGFSMMFGEFSFVNYCNISFTIFKNIFVTVFKQLFLF